MCKVMEDMRNEATARGALERSKSVAHRMLKAGKYALDEIAEISGLSLGEVKKLQAGQGM